MALTARHELHEDLARHTRLVTESVQAAEAARINAIQRGSKPRRRFDPNSRWRIIASGRCFCAGAIMMASMPQCIVDWFRAYACAGCRA